MRKLISFIFVLMLAQHISFAQDNRTFETRVVDILTEMPATNLDILDKQMSELVSLGEKGILKFTEMLTAPDTGGDTKARYALGNLSKYVSSGKNEGDRFLVSQTYLKALDKQEHEEIKVFLIQQIQLVGKNEAIGHLGAYLSNDKLCGPVTQALTAIGSDEAGLILFNILSKLQGQNQVAVVKALGELKITSAEDEISKLTSSDNVNLKKVSLYYLANLPTSSYGKTLETAAENAGYSYEETRATAAYILLAERLAQEGKMAESEKNCKNLIKNAPEHTAGKALSLLVKYNSKLSEKYLLKAMSSDSKKYRENALRSASTITGQENTELWTAKLKKYPSNVQAEIITMLGNRGDASASTTILTYLNSTETEVQKAAIRSLAKLDPENSLAPFIALFPSASKEVLDYLGQTMVWMKTDKVISTVAKAISENSGVAKITLIEIIAAKSATEFKEVVFSETENADADVKLTALSALSSVSEKYDQQRIFDLFAASSDPAELKAIQNALLAIAIHLETSEEKNSFIQNSENLNVEKTALILEILPDLGGKEALNMVVKNFRSENEQLSNSAFIALSNWKGLDAMPTLFDIAKNNSMLHNNAARAYLQQVNKSNVPDAQKLLLYRRLFEITKSADIQKDALSWIGKIKSISALIFVKPYLENKTLQQAASVAVMRIALPSNDGQSVLAGDIVTSALELAIQIIEGPESDYDKAKIQKYLDEIPDGIGFVSLFNGKDLTGWKGLVENPIKRAEMSEEELAKKQAEANAAMTEFWSVKDGVLWFNGKGHNLCTDKKYGDFEMLVDWRISKRGDSGIYLRGTPQVQVWDPTQEDKPRAKVGSGGLFNNKINMDKPLVVADNPIDNWNTFHITMVGEKVTVYLNGQLVVDNVTLENYWDRSQPIFATEQIELQSHGDALGFRDIYVKEIPRSQHNQLTEEEENDGFALLFNGENMDNWVGNKTDYIVEKDNIVIYPDKEGHGDLFTEKEYADFNFRFDFLLSEGANNGLGIRSPLEGDGAYAGIELQILDNTADIYKDLEAYQYHGSAYGIIAAKRGFLKPVGEWNTQEVILKGSHVKVTLNGAVILDGDMKEASENGALDGKEHPGLENKKGHIGFLGHGSVVRFRNIRVKEL